MKCDKYLLIRLVFILCFSYTNTNSQEIKFQKIDSKTASSFRAASVVDDRTAWVSGNNGWFGRSKDAGKTWEFDQIKLFKEQDFRTLYAFDINNAIIANAGSPAYILRTNDGGENWMPVYQNSHPDIFLDGIDFWNDNEGVIYGDPIDGKMTILKTFDRGYTWVELESEKRPVLKENEASFAASGTNIRCFKDNSVAIATGGAKSRIFISDDQCNTWTTLDVPIIQGKKSAGIFSMAFFQEKIVVVGGDYLKEDEMIDHVYISHNSGKKWKKPENPTLGYRESVEFLDDNSLICTGPNGTEISNDNGINWKQVQGKEGMHVVRKSRNGSLIVMAGKNGIIYLVK